VVDDSTVIEGEEIEIDGGLPAPEVSSSRPRPSTRKPAAAQPKTRIESDDDYYDDLEPIPDPAPRRAAPKQTKPRTTNDEDLPTAAPGPKPKAETKPQAKPSPALPDDLDDDIPALDSPR
jgi:hypothetical protein